MRQAHIIAPENVGMRHPVSFSHVDTDKRGGDEMQCGAMRLIHNLFALVPSHCLQHYVRQTILHPLKTCLKRTHVMQSDPYCIGDHMLWAGSLQSVSSDISSNYILLHIITGWAGEISVRWAPSRPEIEYA